LSIILQYRSLFTVEILHDYYLSEDLELFNNDVALRTQLIEAQNRDYHLSQNLAIAPTTDCGQIMRDYRLIFKPTNRGFFVGARVTQIPGTPETFTPHLSLDAPIRLRFVLNIKNPYLFNMTNLRMERGTERQENFLYYFSNRAANLVNHPGEPNRLYLSRPLRAFQTASNYKVGELILQGGDLREAIMDIQAGGTYNNANWKQVYVGQNPHFQFVSTADRLPVRPSIFHHTVFNATENHQVLRILIYDRNDTLLQNLRFEAHDPSVPNPTLRECTLNLRNYAPGIYRLEVQRIDGTAIPAFGMTLYLDDILFAEKPFALIECYHESGPALGEYRWLDETNNNRLRQPLYSLRFKNRSTYWRYYFREAIGFTAVPPGFLTAPQQQILQTSQPLGLSEVTRRVQITLDEGGETVLLPNPSIGSIFPENGRIFSEINMGGGLGPPNP